jgi:hypothetical protein
MVRSGLRVLRAVQAASKPLARGYATSVTGLGREVEGFVGAVGYTPLVCLAMQHDHELMM